jgi:3-methylfumaryl-CoA hydratase
MYEQSITELQNWVGRSEIVEDVLSLSTVANMSATIGSSAVELQNGSPLPPCWHWLFFNRGAGSEKLRLDGTYADSDYMPPILLPRRMWVGNKIEIIKPLTIGSAARRITIVEEITEKTGVSGRLIFLRERMEITDDNCGSLTDWRTLVFRDGAEKSKHQKKTPAPKMGEWLQSINPDPVLLFRYSALTFNSHRIHYDRDYTQNIEGYQDLLVHAPLTATLLLNLLRKQMPLAVVKEIIIRATAPIFIGQSFSVSGTPSPEGKSIQLWATTEDGNLAMTADILV